MNSGKIVADGTGRVDGDIEGSTRGPRGPKNPTFDFVPISKLLIMNYCCVAKVWPFISD